MMHHYKRGATEVESERSHAQIRLAYAESTIHAAELLVRDAGRQIMSLVGVSPEEQTPGFHQSIGRIAAANQMCRDAAHSIAQSSGTSMYYEESPLGRAYRDLQVGSSHLSIDFDLRLESYGRMMVGLPPIERKRLMERQTRDELKATGKDPFGTYVNAAS